MKKRLICFDLDNTLIHSNKAHIIAYKKSLKKHSYKHITNKQLEEKFGISSRIYLKELIPEITKKEIESIRILHDNYLKKTAKVYATKIRGVISTLNKLKKTYKLAIVTNCSRKNIDILTKATKLDQRYFDAIVGNDKTMRPKPAPDEIIKAEHLLNLKADYMVGDTTFDIIAARRAKVKCIAVKSGLHTHAILKKERPHIILKSVKDIPQFLNKK
jgi:pyrophosphatase PpaX